MSDELVKVTRFVRTVEGGRVRVYRPGDLVDAETAARIAPPKREPPTPRKRWGRKPKGAEQ